MSIFYTNRIGQKIHVGDPVVYYGWMWRPMEGTFVGLTPTGMVRIASSKYSQQRVKNVRTGTVYSHGDRSVWKRKPGDFYVHIPTGYLVPTEDYYKIDFKSRYDGTFRRDNGELKRGYEVFDEPYVLIGAKGLERTFKLET